MPYVALEDVGTTKRRSLSGRRRLEVWEKTGGTCILCNRRIDGVRERWIVEHIRALELGGVDDIDNMGALSADPLDRAIGHPNAQRAEASPQPTFGAAPPGYRSAAHVREDRLRCDRDLIRDVT